MRAANAKKDSDREGGAGKEPTPEIWRAAGLEAIELHRGRKVTQSYPRHWHDELYVAAIMGGHGHLECSGASYATPGGSFVVIPPGEVHANSKLGCTFRCMFIDYGAMQTLVEQFTERVVSTIDFRSGLVNDAPVMASFLHLHRLLETREATLHRDTSVSLFLHQLVTRCSATSVPSRNCRQEHAAVRRAKQFLDEHYADRVPLRDLAQLTGLSPFHLHRSFCRNVGMPPHAYQVQLRIRHARSFLRSGREISDTASATGFVDQSHFTYAFKRMMGVTPGQYARARKYNTSLPAEH